MTVFSVTIHKLGVSLPSNSWQGLLSVKPINRFGATHQPGEKIPEKRELPPWLKQYGLIALLLLGFVGFGRDTVPWKLLTDSSYRSYFWDRNATTAATAMENAWNDFQPQLEEKMSTFRPGQDSTAKTFSEESEDHPLPSTAQSDPALNFLTAKSPNHFFKGLFTWFYNYTRVSQVADPNKLLVDRNFIGWLLDGCEKLNVWHPAWVLSIPPGESGMDPAANASKPDKAQTEYQFIFKTFYDMLQRNPDKFDLMGYLIQADRDKSGIESEESAEEILGKHFSKKFTEGGSEDPIAKKYFGLMSKLTTKQRLHFYIAHIKGAMLSNGMEDVQSYPEAVTLHFLPAHAKNIRALWNAGAPDRMEKILQYTLATAKKNPDIYYGNPVFDGADPKSKTRGLTGKITVLDVVLYYMAANYVTVGSVPEEQVKDIRLAPLPAFCFGLANEMYQKKYPGENISVESLYRSARKQKDLKDDKYHTDTYTTHRLGYAVDLSTKNKEKYQYSLECLKRYGFEQSFPDNKRERNHLECVGMANLDHLTPVQQEWYQAAVFATIPVFIQPVEVNGKRRMQSLYLIPNTGRKLGEKTYRLAPFPAAIATWPRQDKSALTLPQGLQLEAERYYIKGVNRLPEQSELMPEPPRQLQGSAEQSLPESPPGLNREIYMPPEQLKPEKGESKKTLKKKEKPATKPQKSKTPEKTRASKPKTSSPVAPQRLPKQQAKPGASKDRTAKPSSTSKSRASAPKPLNKSKPKQQAKERARHKQ